MLFPYSYGIGMIYLVTFLTLSGNLQSGFVAFAADPVENYGLAFIFSLTGYCGANVVLTLVRTFGNQSLYYLYLLTLQKWKENEYSSKFARKLNFS